MPRGILSKALDRVKWNLDRLRIEKDIVLQARRQRRSRETTCTPLVIVKNGDYWIELILRVLAKCFDDIVVLENMAEDRTCEILSNLAQEGLQFIHLKHGEDFLSRQNVVKNIVQDKVIRSPWFYKVDEDEIQFEQSCLFLKENLRNLNNPRTCRVAVHHQFIHPADFFRVTPRYCSLVRFNFGSAFHIKKVKWIEPGYDGFEGRGRFVYSGGTAENSIFFENCIALHCAMIQRSSISSYKGVNDGIRSQYVAPDTSYVNLTLFPKEALECKYSYHNPYLQEIIRRKDDFTFV